MQEIFARADGALIDCVCQPPVDWIDQHMETDCFTLARLCTDLSAVAWILSQAGSMATLMRTGNPGVAVFQFALLAVGLGAIIPLRAVFQQAGGTGRRRPSVQANPLRPAMHTHRVACLLWLTGLLVKTASAPAEFVSWTLLAVGVFATTAVYVGACSNHPPRRREYEADDRAWRVGLVGG